MERTEIIEKLAEYFGIEPDENGEYDLDSYDWQSGCSFKGTWLSLANIVDCLAD